MTVAKYDNKPAFTFHWIEGEMVLIAIFTIFFEVIPLISKIYFESFDKFFMILFICSFYI